jgi:hypothetical protein
MGHSEIHLLDIEALNIEGIFFDELAPLLHLVAQ